MIWIDKKFARILPLEGFKEKGAGLHYANFKCPVCGDSKKSKSKKRGWFINSDNDLAFHCYNCGYHAKFSFFLKTHFPDYFPEYAKEKYLGKFKQAIKESDNRSIFDESLPEDNLISVADLPTDHDAKKYLLDRMIPKNKLKEFLYSDNFYQWCKEQQPENFPKEIKSDRRVIIPFKSREGKLFTAIGRTLDDSSTKYLTIRFNTEVPKVFGLDRVNIHKKIYIVEGPFDSLFLDNAIAVSGLLGNIDSVIKYLGCDKNNIVIVPDNEKRNEQTKKLLAKNIELGYNAFIWPNGINAKDINDLVKKLGWSLDSIQSVIDQNTFKGLKAKIKLNS